MSNARDSQHDVAAPPAEFAFKRKLRAGFTLVEIAIVLVIIGLIIGGIMVGADLIRAATLRSQISQINRYSAATATFQAKYGTLPGDMPAALAAQNGFVSRAGTQGNGDGNGVVEGGWGGGTSAYYGWNICVGETALFWDDLSSASLLDQAFSTPATGYSVPNTTVPRGKISGTYLAVFSSCSAGGCYGPGIPGVTYLALMAVDNSHTGGSPSLLVSQAYQIDEKLDDGAPQTGIVQAFFPSVLNVSDPNTPTWAPNAGADSNSTCFNSGTNVYSTSINGGAALNCSLSLKFR